ncbi:MAG: hypothetical protein HY788_06810 [Deltaproteobacteria bacterium]|nr:hypothetical protein [Deltaproteobacteria bacterium]
MTRDQIAIAALGSVSAMRLIWDRERWVLIAAIPAQPGWLWAAWDVGQRGIVYISTACTAVRSLLSWRAFRRNRHVSSVADYRWRDGDRE